MRRWRQNTSAFRLRARPTDHANTLFCLSLRGESSQRSVALVTIYDWYTRRRCFNFLLAWLHHYLCHSLRTTSNIRYSLAGQDTRLSPERPGFESRWRNSFPHLLSDRLGSCPVACDNTKHNRYTNSHAHRRKVETATESLRGGSSHRGVALVTIYNWYARRRCFNFLLA